MIINNKEVRYDTKTNTYKYFACTCSKVDNDYWKNELDLYKTELDNTDHIVTSMLYDLSFNLDTTITGIWVDMWMGFSASSGSTDYYIECDCFEYGLLSLIKIITQLEEQEN